MSRLGLRQEGFAAALRRRFARRDDGRTWKLADASNEDESAIVSTAFSALPPTILAYVSTFLPAEDVRSVLQCSHAWHLRGSDMALLIRMMEQEARPPPPLLEPCMSVGRLPGETAAEAQRRLAEKRVLHDRWREQVNASTAVHPASYQPETREYQQHAAAAVDPPWRQLHQWSVQHVLIRLHDAPPPVPERPMFVTSMSCSEILDDAADFSDLTGIRFMHWRIRRLGFELVIDVEAPSAATLAGPDAPPEDARLKIHAQLWTMLRRRFAPVRAPLSVTFIDGDDASNMQRCPVVAFGTRWMPPQLPSQRAHDVDGDEAGSAVGTPPLRLHSLVFRTRHAQWMLDTLRCLATPLGSGSSPPLPPELSPPDAFPARRALSHLVPLNHLYFRSAISQPTSSSSAGLDHLRPLLSALTVLAESLQVGLAETLLQPRVLSLYVDCMRGPALCLESFLEEVSVLRARGLLAQLRNLYLLGVSHTLLSPPHDSILPPPFLSVESLVLRGGCLRLPQASLRFRRRAERTPPHAYPLLWRSFPAVQRLELCDVVVPSLAELHSGWLPLQHVKLVACRVVEDDGLLDLAHHVYSQRRVTHLQRLIIQPAAKAPSLLQVGSDVAAEALALLMRPLSRPDALQAVALFLVTLAAALLLDLPLALWGSAIPKLNFLRAALFGPSLALMAWALFEWDAGMRCERPRGVHNIPLVPPPLTSLMASSPKQLLVGFIASAATLPFTYSIASSVVASLLIRLLLSLRAPRRTALQVRWSAVIPYSVRFLSLRALQLYCLGVGAQLLSAAAGLMLWLAQFKPSITEGVGSSSFSGGPPSLLVLAYRRRWELLAALQGCFRPTDWRCVWLDCPAHAGTAPWVSGLSGTLSAAGAGSALQLVAHTLTEGVWLGVLMSLVLSAQMWLLPRVTVYLMIAPRARSLFVRRALRLAHLLVNTFFALLCATMTW